MQYSDNGSNILGWDYSKYDLRMSSQMTKAAYCSLIELAERAGFSKEDLYIMKMMVHDIVHPLLDFNGTLLQLYNMNTSGNSLTVVVNGIVGSFYVRLGFFHVYPEAKDFRSCVAALTYGDDFIGSVSDDYINFNFETYKEFLAPKGIKITPPDKGDETSEFLDLDAADFLKRKSNYIPEIGCSVGCLDTMSIMKSMHANLKSSSASPREVATSVIECACHEYFGHGREVYEDAREKMQEVCRRVKLIVPALDHDFDYLVDRWHSKYAGGDTDSSEDEVIEITSSDLD
jgi:hypothetical protein